MKKYLVVIFASALILRLLLVFSAYHGDLNNNISWGTLAVERGLSGFYESEDQNSPNLIGKEPCLSITLCEGGWPYSAPNQPPLTILMFAGTRIIWQFVENASWSLNNNFQIFPSQFIWFWEEKGMTLLVKLPGIFADIGIGWLIYKYAEQKTKNKKKQKRLPLMLTAVWLFNPVIWYNSAVWGQTDSVVNLLGLVGILALLKKDLVKFALLFTLSFLFKGSLGIFIPILGVVALWQKYPLKEWIRAICYMLLAVIVVSIWFHPRPDLFSWIIELYKDRILPGEIGDLTANAFNFWWLVNPGKVLDSTLFFGLPARVWSFIIALSGMGVVGYWLRKKLSDKRIILSLVVLSLVSFLFMTRIHGRYLYPFFPYATILLGSIPGFTFIYVILSITHFLNLYYLFWAPPFSLLESLYQASYFMQAISIVNILVFVKLLRSAHQRH